MKKLLVGALALFLIAGAAQAQDNGQQQKEGTHHFQKLNLTDAQKTQLKTLHEGERKELEALDKNDQMIVRDWKAKKKEIHERYKTQTQSVFTPEQRDQLAKMREGRENGRFGKGMNGQALRGRKGFKGDAFDKDLNLTQAQKEKMKDLRTQFKGKADAIRNNKDLTQDQRKTQFRDLMKDQREQMKTVLTPEQMEKVQSHMKERRERDTK